MTVEIQDTKPVWVVMSNTDLTEGRGRQIIKAVCDKKATTIRLGKKGYVQGSDCPVRETSAYKINNCWYMQGDIVPSTREDDTRQAALDEKDAMVAKFIEAGFTKEDIDILKRN